MPWNPKIPSQFTRYKHIIYRSKTEARWAAILDQLGVPHLYEPQAYAIGGAKHYLPDFWLPSAGVFLEIKGAEPVDSELFKARQLATVTRKTVLILSGLRKTNYTCNAMALAWMGHPEYKVFSLSIAEAVFARCSVCSRLELQSSPTPIADLEPRPPCKPDCLSVSLRGLC